MRPLIFPSQSQGSHSTKHYYFVIGVAIVAVILLATNVFASGCLSSCRLVQAVKRLLSSQGIPPRSPREDRISRLIPACKYGKQQSGSGNECSVCLTVLEEGDEVRRLPRCEHSFHAPCIDMWLYSHASCPLCRANVLPMPQRSPKAEARHPTLLESTVMFGPF